MVEVHWGIRSNPFRPGSGVFVALPGQNQSIALLRHEIEAGERTVELLANAGLGKSIVLRRVLSLCRSAVRRLVLVTAPPTPDGLWMAIAEALGNPLPLGASPSTAWRALTDAVRICAAQRRSLLLAIDDCQEVENPAALDQLEALASDSSRSLTIIRCGRSLFPLDSSPIWRPTVRLAPLTRPEAELYLLEKLRAAGRPSPIFTPRAISRFHAHSRGSPRGLDRLASLSLRRGVTEGWHLIGEEEAELVACDTAGADPVDQVDTHRFVEG